MRFNTLKQNIAKTRNLAGGDAYVQTPEMQLISLLLTSFVQDQFYRTAAQQLEALSALVAALPDKQLAAKAAVYARNEFGMRSITHALAGEIGRHVKGERWTRPFFAKVVRRPDDVTEILAYTLALYGKPIPNAMKRGLGDALARFDAYQLGKYKGRGAAISLVDAVNLCHPAHTEALAALVNGTLPTPETWEAQLSAAGQADADEEKAARKADVWRDLVGRRKLGYFALLRNLRNIARQAPDVLDGALAMLTDETLIRDSLVLPFRYGTAVREIEKADVDGARPIIAALSDALEISLANVPRLDGRSLVIVDVSGSMTGRPIEIATLFAAVLLKTNDADLMLFDNDARYLRANPRDTVLGIAAHIQKDVTYGGTDFHAPFRVMKRPYDRLIFLSDMQGWIGRRAPTGDLAAFEKKFDCRPFVYNFDLRGYGTTQFPADRIAELAGFSEKVFDIMALLEQDRRALLDAVEAIEL